MHSRLKNKSSKLSKLWFTETLHCYRRQICNSSTNSVTSTKIVSQALIGLPDGPTVSYLRLHYFCSEGTRAFIDAINMSEFWGVDGYIVDLRNNPGQTHVHLLSFQKLTLHKKQAYAASWVYFDAAAASGLSACTITDDITTFQTRFFF